MSVKRLPISAGLLALVAATVDQVTKWWALRALADGPIDIVPTVTLRLLLNDGASFSTGAGNGRLVGILVLGVIGYLVWLMNRHELRAGVLILAVVLGGAIGNALDRLFRAEHGFLTGHVIDFIDVSWFAVFNLADICVVLGSIAFGLVELLGSRRRDKAVDPSPR